MIDFEIVLNQRHLVSGCEILFSRDDDNSLMCQVSNYNDVTESPRMNQ